jgi:CubicO group peptidase (beta-lactamase class C family)
MAHIFRTTLAMLFVVLAFCPAQTAEWSEQDKARASALVERFLASAADYGRDEIAPGMSVAVSISGDPLMARGFGNAQPGLPADANTLYHIGSISKQFTAAAILDLIENKAMAPLSRRPLVLDAEASEIFSGVERWNPKAGKPVTLRRLLNMTSNLPNFTRRPPAAIDPWGAVRAPALLGELKKQIPWGWPDSFEYSNTSYFLLAQAVEEILKARGLPEVPVNFRDYVRTNLLEKAALTKTGFIGAYPHGSSLAQGTYRRKPVFTLPDWLKGSAGMVSNVVDLDKWNTALMEGEILKSESVALMLADGGRVAPREWYGMGWFIEHPDGRDVFSHSGNVPGYSSFSRIVKTPKTWVSVVLLTNSDGVRGLDALAGDLAGLALAD